MVSKAARLKSATALIITVALVVMAPATAEPSTTTPKGSSCANPYQVHIVESERMGGDTAYIHAVPTFSFATGTITLKTGPGPLGQGPQALCRPDRHRVPQVRFRPPWVPLHPVDQAGDRLRPDLPPPLAA